MKITLKLFATLGTYLPRERQGNVAEVEVPEGFTPGDVIERFGVPGDMVHLVLLNGVYQDQDQRASRALRSGDVVAVWPPVAGG